MNLDLYKQSTHLRSGLLHYTPTHCACILALLVFLLSNQSIQFVDSQGDQSDLSAHTHNSIEDSIRVDTSLPQDKTSIPRNKLFWHSSDKKELISELLDTMTDEEIVAQLFLAGWSSEFAEGPIVDWISTRNIGGVKIFGWNGQNLQTLSSTITTLQQLALNTEHGIPLFTATDQEGGWVRHIKDETSITPGNMSIGASALPQDSFLSGYYIGQELRAIGVNMNFAPTVDVYSNKDAHVIGPRAFSSDPDEVAVLGLAFFHGMRQSGVISTAKHFPGHGNAIGDSHNYLPVIQDNLEVLWNRDLLPYRTMIPDGLPAILSGHLNFPLITGDTRPSSLSSYFSTELLRNELQFEGILITDDLYMGAVLDFGGEMDWGMETMVLEALRAGNDMILLSQTPELNDSLWTGVLSEYRGNEDFRRTVRESVTRILKIKMLYLKEDWRVPLGIDHREVYESLQAIRSQPFFTEQAARGVTLIRDSNIPFRSNDNRILLVGQHYDFFSEGRKIYPNAREYYFDYSPFYWADENVIAELKSLVPSYETVIFNLSNPNSLEVLQSLSEFAEKLIVFSTLTPVYIEDAPWVQSAIAVYGWSTESYSAGFAALHGDIPFKGKLPIALDSIE